ncbi:hypothetical protein HW555_003040 [Spodoptera exigua]|uniref:FP protein C-terminal domain-containing protein n=1 Tax=Spodoptera exigua TaxID=7107 RepID=A0A835L8V4_SPOEX|nr:hypothetical protein HW555_003040 [Spodoptera exigua]KAH9628775.1 hypothetical protein HF086_005400 [Spodoptera exigua]
MSASTFKRLSKIARSTWACTNCLSKKDLESNKIATTDDDSDESEEKADDIRKIIRQEIRTTMRAEVKIIVSELRKEIDDLRKQLDELKLSKQTVATFSRDISDLKTSMQFHADEQADIKKCINDISLEGSKQSSLVIDNLVAKIDSMEQQARNCNAEICNVPEKRGENLLNIIEMVGSAVRFPICQKDIVSIHRVQHATQQGNKPKNIVVKFASRILRDNLISAYRLTKTLKAEQIGLPGSSATIYINEHLTLKNKQLFRKTREVAASHNYKYVWIKNSTILVRKMDGTSTFAIRTEDDVRKIKGKDDNIVSYSASENN